MAMKVGKVWRHSVGMINSVFLTFDATNEPVQGDLCDAGGSSARAPQFKATTPGSPTTEDNTLRFICVEGRYEVDAFNNEGTTAGTGKKPRVTNIGSNKARNTDLTGKRKAFVPITAGLSWVMTVKDSTTVTPGSSYKIQRAASGDYRIDGGNAGSVVTVIGVYGPDFEKNGTSATDYWVKATNPGGTI